MTHRAETLELRKNPAYWAHRIASVEESIRYANAPAYRKKLLQKLELFKRHYRSASGKDWQDEVDH